jgi:hypothetical protein
MSRDRKRFAVPNVDVADVNGASQFIHAAVLRDAAIAAQNVRTMMKAAIATLCMASSLVKPTAKHRGPIQTPNPRAANADTTVK